MVQAVSTPTASASIRTMSNEELSDIIAKCESAISAGSAEIEDYEAFVLCQKELARRTWA
jgi:hypothetical protein